MSKLFTSIVVMQQVEAGRVDLDAPVARYLPEFAEHSAASPYDKSGVTVRQLLTHTSGLPRLPAAVAGPPRSGLPAAGRGHRRPDRRGRNPLPVQRPEPDHARVPWSRRVSGKPLDALVADGITRPLRMRDTGYNPDRPACGTGSPPPSTRPSPTAGMVWGEVHDENAWSFGGVAGHAGVFSTARDLVRPGPDHDQRRRVRTAGGSCAPRACSR